MIITDYHVKKVLRTYTRQLQKARLPSELIPKGEGGNSQTFGGERVVISEEARRRLVMEQLVKHAASKLESEKENMKFGDEKVNKANDKDTAINTNNIGVNYGR
ncbi:MAG: hypothetical protein N2260_07275 [Syntrophobacterales bacterium]|nr:hypothetical protein [Syntrophobacterales bacterium]